MTFDAMLDWRLRRGSHPFPKPGKDGTISACFNEVATVVAGFAYREIKGPSDFPPCFSRPIALYTLRLNDVMPDEVRMRLVPFITRMAGSADDLAVERQRAELMMVETARTVLSIGSRYFGQRLLMVRLAACRDLAALDALCRDILFEDKCLGAAPMHLALRSSDLGSSAFYCGDATDYVIRAVDPHHRALVWDATIAILDAALAIGNQAPPIEADVASARLARGTDVRTVDTPTAVHA